MSKELEGENMQIAFQQDTVAMPRFSWSCLNNPSIAREKSAFIGADRNSSKAKMALANKNSEAQLQNSGNENLSLSNNSVDQIEDENQQNILANNITNQAEHSSAVRPKNHKKKSEYLKGGFLQLRFQEVKEKYSDLLYRHHVSYNRPFIIGCGSYSRFFVLPICWKWRRKDFPLLKLYLEDHNGDFFREDQDLICCSYDETFSDLGAKLRSESNGYKVYPHFLRYDVVFMASKSLVERYGSKEKTLKYANMIYGRIPEKSSYESLPSFYRFIDQTSIQIDSYYLAYLIMKNGGGIWRGPTHLLDKDSSLVSLSSKPLFTVVLVIRYKPEGLGEYFARKIVEYMYNESL